MHRSAFPLNSPHLAFKTEVPISDRCFSSQEAEITLGKRSAPQQGAAMNILQAREAEQLEGTLLAR